MGLRQFRIGTGKLVVRVPAAESSLTTALGDANAEGSTDRGSTPRTSTISYDPNVGLISELGYQYGAQKTFQRWVVKVASAKGVSAVMPTILPPMDRFSLRMTSGRATVTSMLSGLPTVWLTTTGSRTGISRTVPLIAFPVGDDLALLGTSFGQGKTPGWVHNIENYPNVTVSFRGVSVSSKARPAGPDEEQGTWELAGSVYPGYLSYGERAPHRRIRVFVLEPLPIR